MRQIKREEFDKIKKQIENGELLLRPRELKAGNGCATKPRVFEPLSSEFALVQVEDVMGQLKEMAGKHRLYCVGDLVQVKNKSGEMVTVRIEGIRHNGRIKMAENSTHISINPRSIPVVMSRLHELLAKSSKSVSTLPALCMLYGVVNIELDNAITRIYIDKGLLENGLFFALGDKNTLPDYGQYAKQLRSDANNWGLKDFRDVDDVCYFSPGFDYEQYIAQHEVLWKTVRDKIGTLIRHLSEMQKILEKPSAEKLIQLYDMLESNYMHSTYQSDLDEYEKFLVGTPKCNLEKRLRDKAYDLESSLNKSGFFDYFGDSPMTAIEKLYDKEKGVMDKESVARYIFGHRKEMTPEKVEAYFRYIVMHKRIEEDLKPLQDERKRIPVAHPVAPAIPPMEQAIPEIIKQVQKSGANVALTVNYFQGDQVTQKTTEIKENYGDNYNLQQGAYIKQDK